MALSEAQQRLIEQTVDCLLVTMAPAEVERWFHLRHRRLDGCRPCDLIRNGRGERVLALAQSIRNRHLRRCPTPCARGGEPA
ncbi:MAG: hypothetical protein ACLGIO_03445 [Acidimicrobiia bacterium]